MSKLRISHFKSYKNIDEAPGQIVQIVRLRIKSGSATSGPPIGPVLGQYAIPISKFCTEFNERTSELFKSGVEVFVTLYYMLDGSYNFSLGLPISSICLRRAVRISKTSGKPKCRKLANMRVRRWHKVGAISQYVLYEVLLYRHA